ncbi:phage portal protein [Hydrogenophaga sp.]|uniref:phage portal protein n=1 Tax=Hydrogenophaga sp. TaxID=1904254 RepID=UPI0027225455|nr:phage portal protein [Hydrogenophaga sp.]MDO8903973.1 phage portal protein [Hydrogenophaga sp.]
MLNLIDKALLPIDPQRVVGRLQARARVDALMSISASGGSGTPGPGGGTSGSGAGTRWWWPFARSAGRDTLPQLGTQRGASRELVRTNPIAAGVIQTNVDRIVGTGLAFVASPNARALGWSADQVAEWKATTQAEYSMWADDAQACDFTGEQNFYEAQGTVVRGTKESGDIFTLLPVAERTRMYPYALRFQLIEADQIGNPMGQMDTEAIAGGIRFGPGGRPLAAHIYDRHPGGGYTGAKAGSMYAGEWVNFTGDSGRRRLLHHYKKLRPGQPRGVPYLAPVIDFIKQIGRFTEAEVNAAVLNAFFTVLIETENGNAAPVFGADGQGGAAPAGGSDEIGLGMGAVIGLAKGEKASFADPKRPNPNADAFIVGMLRLIGMGLGIPVELLTKQFNSSYSASKAALLDAWVYFRGERFWTGLTFCQPIVETWLAEAVYLGRVKAPGFFSDPLLRWAYTRAAWPGDSMGSINPKDEVAAYTAAIDARLMTRERAEWELGGTDWNETFDQKLAEHLRLSKNNLLPVPKAGAPAPQEDSERSSAPSPTR